MELSFSDAQAMILTHASWVSGCAIRVMISLCSGPNWRGSWLRSHQHFHIFEFFSTSTSSLILWYDLMSSHCEDVVHWWCQLWMVHPCLLHDLQRLSNNTRSKHAEWNVPLAAFKAISWSWWSAFKLYWGWWCLTVICVSWSMGWWGMAYAVAQEWIRLMPSKHIWYLQITNLGSGGESCCCGPMVNAKQSEWRALNTS